MLIPVNKKSMELYDLPAWRICIGMITPAQCRAARGLIGWSQQDLAKKAGVGTVAVHQLESGTSQPRRATLDVVKRAFETAGVEFIDENGGGAGVRLQKPVGTARKAK
jgi:transcriptional regulator with XRE-family HTH domain